jgi:hemerythrin
MVNPLYIVWKDEFNLDIPILDEQHHAIVATINSLYFFIQEGWGLAALTPTLNIIKTYSAFHAKTEEGVLIKLNYPSLIHHIECQKSFEKEVNEATNEALLYKDPQILLKFLRTWWLNHLNVEHPEYADYFNKLK